MWREVGRQRSSTGCGSLLVLGVPSYKRPVRKGLNSHAHLKRTKIRAIIWFPFPPQRRLGWRFNRPNHLCPAPEKQDVTGWKLCLPSYPSHDEVQTACSTNGVTTLLSRRHWLDGWISLRYQLKALQTSVLLWNNQYL